jgi:glycosyltransferase involved in cell wall biosynthesis
MTIVYDLRYASDHFTGIGTHAYCLLEALLALPGPERYTVLWNPELSASRFDLDAVNRHPRVNWVERQWAPLGLASLWRVGRWLHELRPTVYLSPFYFMPFRPGCPCVLTLHDVWPLRLPGGLKFWPRALYQLALAHAAQARFIITSSEFSRREIEELSAVEPGQVRVVALGIPLMRGQIASRRPEGAPEGPFALVVGINKPHKNLATLAAAWATLGPDPPLALVSAGPEDPRHPRLPMLARRQRAARVAALGHVDEDELEWLYDHATLGLFPSLYEGFGLPMVEAFGHGVPVVASDIPTLREVGEGVARFVEPLDSVAWAREVRALALDSGARDAMAEAGRARARELTYERTARATLEVLREAAGVTTAALAEVSA